MDSASWRTFTEQKGLMGEAPRNGLGGAITRLKDWLTPNPGDPYGTGWGIMNEVLRDADHPQLTLKLWLAATAEKRTALALRWL